MALLQRLVSCREKPYGRTQRLRGGSEMQQHLLSLAGTLAVIHNSPRVKRDSTSYQMPALKKQIQYYYSLSMDSKIKIKLCWITYYAIRIQIFLQYHQTPWCSFDGVCCWGTSAWNGQRKNEQHSYGAAKGHLMLESHRNMFYTLSSLLFWSCLKVS